MRRTTLTLQHAGVLALALLAAGCGGGGDDSAGAPTETVTVSVAASDAPSDGQRTPGASGPARSTSPTGSTTGSASAPMRKRTSCFGS